MIISYATIGLILGLPLIIVCVFVGAVVGLGWGCINVARRRRRGNKSLQGAVH